MKEVVTRKYHDVEKRRTKIRGGIGQKIGKELVKNRYLYFLLIPVAAYYLIFCYAPMFGLVIAFKQYNIGSGIWNSPWVGLKNFKEFFSGGMVPTYLLVYKWLHLGDSLWALILPTAISTYNLLIMQSNFESLPYSLEEAAKIDGANDIQILFQIVLPLSTSILAVMVLFYGVSYWNSWFQAMMYIRTRAKYPLQLILREILLMNDTTTGMSSGGSESDRFMIGESIKYSTIMVATVPILLIYPFVQKYFVKGVMIGAVKG